MERPLCILVIDGPLHVPLGLPVQERELFRETPLAVLASELPTGMARESEITYCTAQV